MKRNKYLFKASIVFVILVMSISANSNSDKDNTNFNPKVIVEGVVTRINGGGTREIQYHSGYAIINPKWIIAPPITNTTVFLRSNNLLGKFSDKEVHVEGTFLHVPGKKYDEVHSTYDFDEIVVDTIYCTR